MATQRLTIAALAGQSANIVVEIFERWRLNPEATSVDRFCRSLREHGHSLSVVYFGEWVDRWLIGDVVPGPGAVEGRHFQATCMLPEQAVAWASECGGQFREQEWLAARLREAAAVWTPEGACYAVVVVREVIDISTLDEDVQVSVGQVPSWLLQFARTTD